jgi:hypothetical protein
MRISEVAACRRRHGSSLRYVSHRGDDRGSGITCRETRAIQEEGGMTDCYIHAEITRFVENYPPGIIECRFSDANNRDWFFVGKFYDFTDEELSSESVYPRSGFIPCEIISRWTDEHGRVLAEVETDQIQSWRSHESVDGHSRFIVLADQLENH